MSQAIPIRRERRDHRILTRLKAYVPRLDAAKLAFGVKLALAILIAVWVELWFDLGMVDSVAICVLVVKSNLLGTTIQKSILRMIGNLIGCSVGFAMLALFAQDRVTGTIVFSLYSVFCCFFLQRSRYAPAWHWIYDSAAIVFVFHLGSATGAFTFTAERWLELSIGILSMTLVSSILWPSRTGTVFEEHFQSLLQDLTLTVGSLPRVVESAKAPPQATGPRMLGAEIPALHKYLDIASRDTSRYERFYDGYQSAVTELQSLIARTARLEDSLSQLMGTQIGPEIRPRRRRQLDLVADALERLKASMDELIEFTRCHFETPQSSVDPPATSMIREAIERVHSSVNTADYSIRDAAATLHVCEMIGSVADEIERLSNALVESETKRGIPARLSAIASLDSERTPFWKRLDVHKSLVCGVTVALAFTIWMLTNWPAGTFGVFFAVLITSKYCTTPYLPPQALIPGAIVGIFVGSVMYLGLLPKLDGFWQLVLVLFPFLVVSGYLMLSSNVKIAGVAGLTAIVAIKLMDLQAHQTISFSHIVTFSYGVLGGTFLGFIVLGVMWPIVPEKMFTGQVKEIINSCRQWLRAVSSDARTSPASRSAFAQKSAKQFGLCLMWGKFMNYQRLPAESRAAVTRLTAAIQSTILQLIELDRLQHSEDPAPHFAPLRRIADQLDEELCDLLDALEDSINQCRPVPQLTRAKSLLGELLTGFTELCEGRGDKAARREAARRALVMIGQYGALVKALDKCSTQIEELDWKSLNQSYF